MWLASGEGPMDDDKKNPYLPDPEWVKIMTSRAISKETIAHVGTELHVYLRDKNLTFEPRTIGELLAALCEMAREEKSVNQTSVERLLKFKGLA